LLNGVRNTDRPGDAQRLQSGGDVDVFAVYITAARYDASLIHSDTKLDPAPRSQRFVQPEELSLYPDGACDGCCGGIERGEDSIAGIVVDTPPMLSYGCGENIQALFESTVCTIFVERTESTVVSDVGINDRGLMSRKRFLFLSD